MKNSADFKVFLSMLVLSFSLGVFAQDAGPEKGDVVAKKMVYLPEVVTFTCLVSNPQDLKLSKVYENLVVDARRSVVVVYNTKTDKFMVQVSLMGKGISLPQTYPIIFNNIEEAKDGVISLSNSMRDLNEAVLVKVPGFTEGQLLLQEATLKFTCKQPIL